MPHPQMDGLGWGDLSATTGRVSTPNMDKLYNNGVRLQRHYVHLMGSPSRTQFLTGRYAMNLGFGEFNSWDDSVAGGIPAGQPTLANWLRELGGYTTYGVGKWHLGYANRQLLPAAKGFDHFYGFYQGAIAYDSKKYNYNGRMVHDFWEDGEPSLDAVDSMRLYAAKIDEYLETEAPPTSSCWRRCSRCTFRCPRWRRSTQTRPERTSTARCCC